MRLTAEEIAEYAAWAQAHQWRNLDDFLQETVMDPVTTALLANLAIDLATRLVSEYMNDPDSDPAEVEKLNAKLDATVEMVKSKKPVPRPGAPTLDP